MCIRDRYFYSCRYNYDFGGKQCGCTIMEQDLIKVVHNLLTTQIAVLTDSARTEASMRGVMDRELKNHDMRIQKIQKQIDRKNYEESKEYQSYVTGEILSLIHISICKFHTLPKCTITTEGSMIFLHKSEKGHKLTPFSQK